jgi:hypothetical protein
MTHVTQIGFATVWQVKAADGSIMWEGSAIIGQAFEVVNGGAASQNPWYPGTPIVVSALTTIGHPWNLSTAAAIDQSLVGVRCTATTNTGYLGVSIVRVAPVPAILPVAPPYAYPRGIVASTGSIVPVNITAAAVAGSVVGVGLQGSATAGHASVATPGTTNLSFGTVIKAGVDLGLGAGIEEPATVFHGRYSAGVLVHLW